MNQRPTVPVPRLASADEVVDWAGKAVPAIEQIAQHVRDCDVSLDRRMAKLERFDDRIGDIYVSTEIAKDTLSTQYFCYSETYSITIILPPFESCPGRVFGFKKMSVANTVTLKVGSGLVEGAATLVISVHREARTVQSDGHTGWWII